MTKVFLAVGHGLKPDGSFDPGAVGGGWSEQSAGDYIVQEAAGVLRQAGFDVLDEAFKDDLAFRGTTRQANAWGADLVVSVHHDWVKAPFGSFGHWLSPAGKRAADRIQAAVGKAGFPLRPSWHKRRTDLYLLNNTAAPTVLYEVGRIGQAELNSSAELRKMGRAIAAGIMDWAGVEPAEEEDVEEVLAKLAEIDAKLGERDERPSMWRDTDRTKQAAGRLELAVQALPARVAAAVADELAPLLESPPVAGGVTVDPDAVADAVVAAIAQVWSQ